jgi:hypothetical protein
MDSLEYKIVIPTYKRVETLKNKTLFYLQKCNIPMEKVWLFVASQDEYESYKHYLDLGLNIVVGVPVLMHQRNFVKNYFEQDQAIVQIDDDIEDVYVKIDDKKYEPFYDLDSLINQAFAACIEHNTKFWGISAVLNAMFMKHGYSTNLKFCVGCFWGEFNDKEIVLSIDEKEDYERTIKYYEKYGAVIRFNGYAPKTKFYKEGGGMQEYRTDDHSRISAEYLMAKYPNYVSVNNNRVGEKLQIRLYHNPKKEVSKSQTSLF